MKIEKRCMFLLGSFYAMNCVMVSYSTYYLGIIGLKNRTIGLLISMACLAGAFLQVIAGRVADKNPKWYWKNQLVLYTISILILMLSLVFFKNKGLIGIIYGIIILLILVIMPMAHTACFYYSSRGENVNFGVVRSVGSLTFAAASFAVGKMTASMGSNVVPIAGMVIGGCFLITVIFMPQIKNDPLSDDGQSSTSDITTGKSSGFVRRYPVFIVMALAMTLVLILHNMINTYLIRVVEKVGGDSSNLGIALGIAAIVELPVFIFYSRIERKKEKSATAFIIIACAFFFIRGVLFLFARNVFMIYIVQLLQSLSYALLTVSKASYANMVVSREDETTGQSVMTVTDAMGSVGGSLLGGVLVDQGGVDLMLMSGTIMALLGTIVAGVAGAKKLKST